jgi:drug/metabolite transporter (DMT)-like permease
MTGKGQGSPVNSSDNRPMQAVALILLSIVFFDVMAILVRLLLDRYSAQELSAYRNVFGALPSIALLMWTRELKLNRDYLVIDRWKLAVMRGLIVALAQLCF